MAESFDVPYVVDTLLRLVNTPSVSGKTEAGMRLIGDELKKLGLTPRRTAKGSLLVTLPGQAVDAGERTLSAHVDTLGAMVSEVKENGRLAFALVGGYMLQAVEGEYCTVETTDGRKYTGTILSIEPTVHVYDQPAKLERKQANMEVRLDARVQDKAAVAALGIHVGDYICFDPRAQHTSAGFVKARHLDDKAGVAILLGAIRHTILTKTQPAVTTHLFFSAWEEVGHGAAASIPANTREFVAVDMGAIGKGQASDEYSVSICAKDSSGPYHYGLRQHLTVLAAAAGAPYKVDIYPHYGSDASAALRSGLEAACGLIGPGVDASHAYERTHEDALKATGDLVLAYLASPLLD